MERQKIGHSARQVMLDTEIFVSKESVYRLQSEIVKLNCKSPSPACGRGRPRSKKPVNYFAYCMATNSTLSAGYASIDARMRHYV